MLENSRQLFPEGGTWWVTCDYLPVVAGRRNRFTSRMVRDGISREHIVVRSVGSGSPECFEVFQMDPFREFGNHGGSSVRPGRDKRATTRKHATVEGFWKEHREITETISADRRSF